MALIVLLQDGRSGVIPIPEGVSEESYLHAFLHGQYPFNIPWVELASGEHVKHDFIVSIRPGD